MHLHSDDRRTVWADVLAEARLPGDLNVTWVEPGALLAWHRHEQQDDWMLVVEGTLKVGMWVDGDPESIEWQVLTDRNPEPLFIPRGEWHGYQNIGPGRACVITYITQPYNPSDELRLDPRHVPISWERIAR